jgi:hypothetical protein
MNRLVALVVPLLILALIALIAWAIVDSTCGGEPAVPTPSPSPSPTATPTPEPTAPDAPSLLQAIAVSSGSIGISWQDNSDNELGFEIERKTGADGIYRGLKRLGADVVGYRDTGLYETTTYYYRVRAYNEVGRSDYANEDSALTLEPTEHLVGDTTVGAGISVAVNSAWKSNRYCNYQTFNFSTYDCDAPPGNAFIAASVTISNTSNTPLTVKRVDMRLRNHDRDMTYGWYYYVKGDLGEPFPDSIRLAKGETASGAIVYLVPSAHPLYEMEMLYIIEDEVHVWRLQ